jgi:RNA polymerase sigma factor (TIGR02999 family)
MERRRDETIWSAGVHAGIMDRRPSGRHRAMNDEEEVTRLLLDWQNGNKEALDRLLPIVYTQLKALASNQLRNERPGHTLQPTALIHEAYVRLVRQDLPEWKNRAHFFSVSARLMRQILVDHARKHRAAKRGGDHRKVSLEDAVLFSSERSDQLIQIDDALREFEVLDPRKCKVIELRYFAGLEVQEISEALKISLATVKRDLRLGEAWLKREFAK